MKILIFSLAALLTLFTSARSQAADFDIISYGSNGTTMSGELILIIEHMVKDPKSGVKLIGMKRGVGYRQNSEFVLTGDKKASELLNQVRRTKKENIARHHYFESARSLMTFSPETPKAMLEIIKKKKSSYSSYHEFNRIWNDLKWGTVEGGRYSKSKYPYYNFKRSEWNIEKQWRFAFFVTYTLSMNGKEFSVTALPKEYGGIWRTISSIKTHRTKNSLILGIGGITPGTDHKNRKTDNIEELGKLGEQYVAAGHAEVSGYRKSLLPYFAKWDNNPPIQFLSANLFEKSGKDSKRLFKPYTIVRRAGKRIAIIGMTTPKIKSYFERNSEKYPWFKNLIIKDTRPVLEEIYDEIQGKFDFVILLTNFRPKEYAKEEFYLSSVDLAIHRSQRYYGWQIDRVFDVKNYAERAPRFPIYAIPSREVFVHVTKVGFKRKDVSIHSRSVALDYSVVSDGSSNSSYDDFASLFTSKDVVLPDHRKLYPKKITITAKEFATLSAEMMRRELRAEIGIFNRQDQFSDITGEQDASIIKSWIRPEAQLVVFNLKGADLADIIRRNKTAEYPNELAIAGIDSDGHVNGIPIQPNESYRVVASTGASENLTSYPSFKRSSEKIKHFISHSGEYEEHQGGKPIALHVFMADVLRKNWKSKQLLPEEQRKQDFRDLYEGKSVTKIPGYWVHDLKTFRLEYSQLKTNDLTNFQNVQDSRLKATDQKIFSGSFAYTAIYRKKPYVTEIGAKGRYAKIELRPTGGSVIENVLSDDLVYFANIGLPIFTLHNLPSLGAQMGPFLEVAFDTEFEKDDTSELEKNLLGFLGWKLNNGTFTRTLSLSGLWQRRLTNNSEKSDIGLNLRAEVAKPFWQGKLMWRSDLDYRYFFGDNDDSNEDLKTRLVWDNYLDLNIVGGLSFGPYFKYVHFTGKTFSDTATQTVIGVNLSFSKMWKPKYQRNLLF